MLSKACRALKALLGWGGVSKSPQNRTRASPRPLQPGLLRAPLLYNQTSESAKTLHKNVDLQHKAELLDVFPSEQNPEGFRAPEGRRVLLVCFVLPRFSDANGAEEQIYQEFGHSVFVYRVQRSGFLCSLRCYA